MNDYREITKLKNNIATKSILKILGYTFVVILIFSLIVDGFYNDTIANEVSSFNRSLYLFFVRNKTIMMVIFYMIIFIGITFIVTRNMSQKMLEIMKSVDKIIKEPDKEIKLSNDLILLENKLNKIRLDLINSQNAAREAENKKNDLIMYMAHDLKTPLTSVIGYLNLLTDEKDISKQSQEKYIKIALDKALRVEELTNQFFEITRYNIQDMPISKQKLDIPFLIEQLVDECYPMLQERNLKCKITKPEHLYYEGDGDKLARAFGNLLKNAINYSYENTNTILQYSVGDINNWTTYTTEGFEVNKNTTIYGRFYNATTKEIGYAFTIKVQVIDDIGPQITIIKQTTTSKTITIEVESKDNELGMPDTITYQYYIGTTKDNQKLVEAKTANTITYDNLQANTKYIVKVQTKDKMENVGTIEKEITTASPILVNEMTLDKENEKIGSNNTLQITATIKPENADDKSLTWSSSDDTIATVSNTGLVTPKKEGNVIITCTTNDGSNISKTCNIQILNGSLIYTRAELDAIRNNPGGSYILMNDIDLSGKNWTPIPQFWGTLDGNGHSIDNMTIINENSNNRNIAFIKTIPDKSVNVTIKNIKFKNVNISSNAYEASTIIAGFDSHNIKVELLNIGVENGNIIGEGNVGSLVTSYLVNNNLKIENCYSHANLTSLCDYDAGGLLAPGDKQFSYNISNYLQVLDMFQVPILLEIIFYL